MVLLVFSLVFPLTISLFNNFFSLLGFDECLTEIITSYSVVPNFDPLLSLLKRIDLSCIGQSTNMRS